MPTLADPRAAEHFIPPTLPQQPDYHAPLPAIAGYEVLGELGRGGMGIVYKARQVRLQRVVALKMILAGKYASRQERERFLGEAQAAAALHHPNIVQIYEVEEHEGCPFFSLEYIDGPSLASKYSGAPQSPRLAAQLVETLARAMHYAHEHGIIHRDLKPGNILLTQDSVPKITDFGLAKQLKGEGHPTRTGAILGTPGYMAPEQAEGQSKSVGPPTDVYSLGAILYELLGGRPPFEATTPTHTLLDLLRHDPVSLSRLQPGVPRDAQTICEKCMQKDPARRYPTAEALANDLQRFLTDRPIEARRTGTLERLWRWRKRNPVLAALSGTVALLLLFLTIGSVLTAAYLHRDLQRVKVAEQQAQDKLWEASLAHAEAGRRSGTVGRRFDSLDSLAEAARIRPSLELRNEAIACLALTDLRCLRRWSAEPGTVRAFDHRCRRYAEAGPEALRLCAADTDEELLQLPGCEVPAVALAFSPDDRWLLVQCRPEDEAVDLLLWDLQDRTSRTLGRREGEAFFAFSPDSRLLALAHPDGTLRLQEVAGGKEVQRLKGGPRICGVCFDPEGKHLAICRQDSSDVEVHEVAGGKRVRALAHTTAATTLAWSPDGGLLAVGCENFRIYVWDTAEQRKLQVLDAHRGPLTRLAFDHDGTLLLSTSRDLTGRLWDPWTGRQLLQMPADQGAWFSRDDQRLAVRRPGDEYRLYEVAGSTVYHALHGHRRGGRGPWAVSFSPDGRWLSSGSGDGVRLWDLAQTAQVGHLPTGAHTVPNKGGPAEASQGLFLPSGQALLVGGVDGLHTWPLGRSANGTTLRLGPPRSELDRNVVEMTLSGDGKTLALLCADSPNVLVRFPDGKEAHELGTPSGVQSLALSPDGRWLALGTARQVQIWDTRKAELAHTLMDCCAPAVFSPNGRWLATSSPERYHLWHTGSWEQGPKTGRHRRGMDGLLAFSPDGGVLAVAFSNVQVDLLEAATGQRLARLEAPEPALLADLCFSPDGGRLAVATQNHLVHLWDLRQVRAQLAPLGLDWHLAPYPPLPDYPPALRLQILRGKEALQSPQR
jgi:serine/threonine protein kinase/WD40 repeat protein